MSLFLPQVSFDGFVLLGAPWASAPPCPPTFPSSNVPAGTRVIAPFWSDVRSGLLTKVWVQLYYKYTPELSTSGWNSNITNIQNLVNNITSLSSTGFEPLQTLVVTWENMVPFDDLAGTEVSRTVHSA